MQNDPKYKKYAQQVEKCLASFEAMHEWPDFIAFLKQLLKVSTPGYWNSCLAPTWIFDYTDTSIVHAIQGNTTQTDRSETTFTMLDSGVAIRRSSTCA